MSVHPKGEQTPGPRGPEHTAAAEGRAPVRTLARRPLSRRTFLGATARAVAGLAALANGPWPLLGSARAQGAGGVRRLIIFYFPDGVPGASEAGEASLWHPSGAGDALVLPDLLSPLAPFRDQLVAFRGLTMGGTDEGSHPGGARKLLTARDQGDGESLDRVLARTVGADRPHRQLYLGAMATADNASGDKYISYTAAGVTAAPEDDPLQAFGRLFAGVVGGGGPDPALLARWRRRQSVLDTVGGELDTLRGRVTGLERAKLSQHLEGLREVELRVAELATGQGGTGAGGEGCDGRPAALGALRPERRADPAEFPAILAAQRAIAVQALACDLSRVAVIQAAHHTSELVMSRFEGTPLHTPDFDMRSHQASHYGPRHDLARREFAAYLAQRRWFVEQYAALLADLAARPEGDGTMLDHSLVLCCTEVCDGNTHRHGDMPFLLAGGRAAGVRTGRLLQPGERRHGDLLAAIGTAMGLPLNTFGALSDGVYPGLLAVR